MKPQKFWQGNIEFGGDELFLISGPCVIEDEKVMYQTAEYLANFALRQKLPLIFKSSFVKDNRSSSENYYGPGLEKGLTLLAKLKSDFGFLLCSDIHSSDQAQAAGEVLDIIQIPAYLCMQTSLLQAAAKTQKVVNIKHGQFLAPKNMRYPVQKCVAMGNYKILLTERGYSFGYNDLVVDPRSFYLMRQIGFPLVMDITHSIRKYGVPSKSTAGGSREYLPVIARSSAAGGIDGVYIEVHPEPRAALCDAASQLPLTDLPKYWRMLKDFHQLELTYRQF